MTPDKIRVVIIGYGTVGKNLAKELEVLEPDIFDRRPNPDSVLGTYFTNIDTRKWRLKDDGTTEPLVYDVAFICVDTPCTEESVCDITQVRMAIEETPAKVYVIKSTVLPQTTRHLEEEFEVDSYRKFGDDSHRKHIIFSPEYYGATQHCNNFDFNFTILGGNEEDCLKVQQVLQHVYDARHTFHIVDSTTAELAKYMENCWIAMKVSFCCNFRNIAKLYGSLYEPLRELFILDPRVNPSHTFVYDEKPYWSSHCLDKDVNAIAEASNNDFLKFIVEFNNKSKNKNSQ